MATANTAPVGINGENGQVMLPRHQELVRAKVRAMTMPTESSSIFAAMETESHQFLGLEKPYQMTSCNPLVLWTRKQRPESRRDLPEVTQQDQKCLPPKPHDNLSILSRRWGPG